MAAALGRKWARLSPQEPLNRVLAHAQVRRDLADGFAFIPQAPDCRMPRVAACLGRLPGLALWRSERARGGRQRSTSYLLRRGAERAMLPCQDLLEGLDKVLEN